MTGVERQQAIYNLLKRLDGLEPLKELLWSELGYQRVNQPLSRRDWSDTATSALVEDPILFASGGQDNDFHVLYARLANKQLLLGQERPVVSRLLREHPYALFIFSNEAQDHWHFVNVKYEEEVSKRRSFRRITVSTEEKLRTASERLAMLDLETIKHDLFGLSPLAVQERHDTAFDVEAVTKNFFEKYKAVFGLMEASLREQTGERVWAHDYILQFINRCMFIYFIQRKGWLGNDRDFLASFWKSYQRSSQSDNSFVANWLNVLFFEAFNDKYHGGHTQFPEEISSILQLAPYLNGGLFTRNNLDMTHTAEISDRLFGQVFRFLESHNFTIAEDSPLDKEVAVDPEMIGKVYESLVNVSDDVDEQGEAGIFYTPRTEIDLMCRLSLADNLTNHLGKERRRLLNQLIFALEPEEKADADSAVSDANLWDEVNRHLRGITVLDPACGSGSFLVGMLNILNDLQERANRQLGEQEDSYQRKKRIIGQSLYGVDVMDWACHIAELRLWLSLIIDADFSPEELHVRQQPLLPHFSFKVRCGDSLVQEVGGINLGHGRDSRLIPHHQFKPQIEQLKEEKIKFYNNDNTGKLKSVEAIRNEEKRLFLEMLNARHQAFQEEIKSRRRKLEGPQTYQIGLDGKGAARPHQIDLEANRYRQEIENLTIELTQTEVSQKALSASKEVPFVWDIAFVEIFEGEHDGFDIVMGNPPYVRQEVIAAPVVHGVQITDDKREYKAKLALSAYRAFPQFFGYKASSNTAAHKINAKSDLYIYFYLHGLSLLNDKGSFCFITSNSWLDVRYGADLQEFLLKHSHVKLVLDNQVKRSFANADVNSVIVLFSKPDDSVEWALEKTARFVMFKVPFEHIIYPVIFDEIEETEERKATKEYRVFPIQQGKLLKDGCEISEEEEAGKAAGPLIKTARYIGNKWGGKFLRAPEVFWRTLERLASSTIPFDSIVHKDYGIKPGCVEFFYVDQKTKEEFGIEERFLAPIINSSRHIDSIYFGPNTNLFYCHESKDRLEKGTLDYIKWGEGQGFYKLPSTMAHRPFWYSVTGEPVDFLLLQFWDKRFWTPIAETSSVMCSNNFFYGRCLQQRDNLLLQMNSSWYFMQIELFGRSNQGQGVLTTYGPDYEYIRFILPSKFTSEEVALGQTALKAISQRSILPIWDELKLADRKALDDIVFNIIGLSISEREEFYSELNRLVMKRMERASSLG